MRTFVLSINLNNDAFLEHPTVEILECLDRVSRQVDAAQEDDRFVICLRHALVHPVRDSTGNTVGSWRICDDTLEDIADAD